MSKKPVSDPAPANLIDPSAPIIEEPPVEPPVVPPVEPPAPAAPTGPGFDPEKFVSDVATQVKSGIADGLKEIEKKLKPETPKPPVSASPKTEPRIFDELDPSSW